MPRRAVRLLLAAACLIWQVEWAPVAAALTAGQPAAQACACWGTDACCCASAVPASQSHGMCHLPESAAEETAAPPTAADYLLQPAHCGDTQTAMAPGIHRDPCLLASPAAASPDDVAWPAPSGLAGLTGAHGAADLLFVPPEHAA
jgi:hypothetical protein